MTEKAALAGSQDVGSFLRAMEWSAHGTTGPGNYKDGRGGSKQWIRLGGARGVLVGGCAAYWSWR